MVSSRTVETVWCDTCQKDVIAQVDRFLKGTSLARCSWCGAILHPPAQKAAK